MCNVHPSAMTKTPFAIFGKARKNSPAIQQKTVSFRPVAHNNALFYNFSVVSVIGALRWPCQADPGL